MEIFSVEVDGKKIDLASSKRQYSNKIDLLTGPNGSGKTRILSALAEKFRVHDRGFERARWTFNEQQINVDYDELPKKVIAQTYSPFSRFPLQVPDEFYPRESLTDIYGEGVRRKRYYNCLGLFRSDPAMMQNVSKTALEISIFNISESPGSAQVITGLMPSIGLLDRFSLKYRSSSEFRKLLFAYEHGSVGAILEFLNKRRNFGDGDPIARELRQADPVRFAELLAESFNILDMLRVDNHIYEAEFGSHSRRNSYDYAIVQVLSLFRQLQLLSLMSCELTDFNYHSFDVAQASSGQQQMICSIMELASSLENDSLVLIDEPELSLHPKWQQMYLDHLHAALDSFHGCHVLIATHSPLVVQRGLQAKEGVIQLGGDHSYTSLSATTSVEGTLLDVFDTPVSDSVYLANQILSAIARAEEGGVRERNFSLNELRRLESIYSKSPMENKKTISLIRQALELIEQGS